MVSLTVTVKLTVIEPFFDNDRVLRNITDVNPLCHNDNECCLKIVMLVKVVNDAAPCCTLLF